MLLLCCSIQQYLQRWVCTSGGKIAYTANGRAVNSQDPSFAQTMNAAFLAMVYGQKIQYAKSPLPYQATTPFMDEAKSQRWEACPFLSHACIMFLV